ncbi:MAG: mobile mystery protein B [Nitrospirota bacterium]|nr:mobile mystery protein B [Nitrospirota bacterium]MDH5586085.1 mobile mystery protein B [Nitrospirota bacterium]
MILAKSYGAKTMADDSQPLGATPGGDVSGLILGHLSTPAARNAAEAEAIDRAYVKHVFRGRRKKRETEWLTDDFIRKVHADMFGTIWEWGGQYRQTKMNIGVEPHRIREQIKLLTGDFVSWNDPESTMSVVEIAACLQHRLTQIHPFLNGNGRHARLLTDIFFHSRHHPIPQWPQVQLMAQGNQIREVYIRAMKDADAGDITELIQFIDECLKESNESPFRRREN